MRLLLAGIIGGFVGLIQLFIILLIETSHDNSPSGLLASDTAFSIFAIFVLVEIFGVITLSIYRISPWVLRLLRADWDAQRTIHERNKHSHAIHASILIATIGRRATVMIDTQTYDSVLFISLIVALAAFIIPKPKKRKNEPNK